MRILKTAILISLCILLAAVSRPAAAAEVAQGKTLVYDEAGHSLTIENEGDQAQLVFDLTQAKVGLTPEPGDVVRVAYKIEGPKNMALKVMNVTKQNLRKEQLNAGAPVAWPEPCPLEACHEYEKNSHHRPDGRPVPGGVDLERLPVQPGT